MSFFAYLQRTSVNRILLRSHLVNESYYIRINYIIFTGQIPRRLRRDMMYISWPERIYSQEPAFIGALTEHPSISISMDGRGRALDNIFVERFWRSVKHEDIYLKGYATAAELQRGLKKYFI